MYTEKLCDNDSSIHTIYTDLTVIITFLVTTYIIKLVLDIYLRKVYLPETKDLPSLSNSNDIVSHTSFE